MSRLSLTPLALKNHCSTRGSTATALLPRDLLLVGTERQVKLSWPSFAATRSMMHLAVARWFSSVGRNTCAQCKQSYEDEDEADSVGTSDKALTTHPVDTVRLDVRISPLNWMIDALHAVYQCQSGGVLTWPTAYSPRGGSLKACSSMRIELKKLSGMAHSMPAPSPAATAANKLHTWELGPDQHQTHLIMHEI